MCGVRCTICTWISRFLSTFIEEIMSYANNFPFSFLVFMLFTFLAFFTFIMDRTSSIMLIKSGRCPYLLPNLRGKAFSFLLLTVNLWAFIMLSYIPEGNTFIHSLLPLSRPTTCRALWSEKIKVYIHIYIYVGTDNFKKLDVTGWLDNS